MEIAGDYPDVVIGCCGGGSNFAGIAFPSAGQGQRQEGPRRGRGAGRLPDAHQRGLRFRLRRYRQDGPHAMMYTLGHDFMPPGIHAGGLRYHGDSPLVSQLYHDKLIEAKAYNQIACSRRRCSSPRPKGSSRRPNRPRHPRRHRRGAAGKGRGEREDHPVQPVGHGHWTWRPMTPISAATWRITNIRRRRSRNPWPISRRSLIFYDMVKYVTDLRRHLPG